MLRRIQSREPYYDHKKWEEERLTNIKYLNNCRSRDIDSLRKSMGGTHGKTLPPMTRTLPKPLADGATPAAMDYGDAPAAAAAAAADADAASAEPPAAET
jgi:hypothetical protein